MDDESGQCSDAKDFRVPAFAGTMGRFPEYQHCLALKRTRFAGAGELCMDTQDGQDRIDEMLYTSPERKWIEGANNRVKSRCSTS
ncbi:MAG: hypothetical protein OXF79_29130 [Chloroflexi bacterium]|nr:hypothetical protein [Chloroflexota bacterium]